MPRVMRPQGGAGKYAVVPVSFVLGIFARQIMLPLGSTAEGVNVDINQLRGPSLERDIQAKCLGQSVTITESGGIPQCERYPIRILNVSCAPTFVVATQDPPEVKGFAFGVENSGCWDRRVHAFFAKILQNGCRDSNGKRSLVVDVGAHFGFFSALAAKFDCRVVSIEANPLNIQPLTLTVHLNGLEDSIKVIHAAITEGRGQLSFKAGAGNTMGGHLAGTWKEVNDEGSISYSVQALPLDDIIKEKILLMKIDTEGNEPAVISSAVNLVEKFGVDHILMEWNPYYMTVPAGVKLLNYLTSRGYDIFTVDDLKLLEPNQYESFTQLLKDFKHPVYVHYTDIVAVKRSAAAHPSI